MIKKGQLDSPYANHLGETRVSINRECHLIFKIKNGSRVCNSANLQKLI